jgi:malonyl-CoA O-methyltransferase
MKAILAAREGYRLWAPSYAQETVASRLDDLLVAALTPPLAGQRLLDAGCGTGRRLRDCDAATAVGVDLSPEMLDAGLGHNFDDGRIQTMVGDVRDLPLADRAFDIVWCRLVIGHLPALDRAYAELARVADAGAAVIVTDFHPDAIAAGHKRTFRSGSEVHELEHHVHDVAAHVAAAGAVGLVLIEQRDAKVGVESWELYLRASRPTAFFEHVGLPLVLGLAFRLAG